MNTKSRELAAKAKTAPLPEEGGRIDHPSRGVVPTMVFASRGSDVVPNESTRLTTDLGNDDGIDNRGPV